MICPMGKISPPFFLNGSSLFPLLLLLPLSFGPSFSRSQIQPKGLPILLSSQVTAHLARKQQRQKQCHCGACKNNQFLCELSWLTSHFLRHMKHRSHIPGLYSIKCAQYMCAPCIVMGRKKYLEQEDTGRRRSKARYFPELVNSQL